MVMVWNYYYLSQGGYHKVTAGVYLSAGPNWNSYEQLFQRFYFLEMLYMTWYFDDSWDYGGTLTFGLTKIIGQHQKASGFCVAHIHTTLLYRC